VKKLAAIAIALVAMSAALVPRDLVATKTVGHQARVHRMRNIDSKPQPSEFRVCAEDEISTDRDPCLGANGRLDYQPGR
jgi:hypothetical protein